MVAMVLAVRLHGWPKRARVAEAKFHSGFIRSNGGYVVEIVRLSMQWHANTLGFQVSYVPFRRWQSLVMIPLGNVKWLNMRRSMCANVFSSACRLGYGLYHARTQYDTSYIVVLRASTKLKEIKWVRFEFEKRKYSDFIVVSFICGWNGNSMLIIVFWSDSRTCKWFHLFLPVNEM